MGTVAVRKAVEQMLLAAIAMSITAAPNLLRPLSTSKASTRPVQIGRSRNALAVVDGERGATARLARATDNTTLSGLPPMEVAIQSAMRLPRPEDSIPFAKTKPDRIIQRPLPP